MNELRPADLERIRLPRPDQCGKRPLETLLRERRSRRRVAPGKLALSEVGQLLWAAQGVTGANGRRTAPSAGALYPLLVRLIAARVAELAAGLYAYEPAAHALRCARHGDLCETLHAAALWQESVERAAALIALCAEPERTTQKYGERGLRYVYLEAGHAAQNVYLQATALGLAVVALGAFRDAELAKALALEPGQVPVYLIPVGPG